MAAKRRKYTREFKLDAVRMVVERGLAPTQVAKDLGIDRSLISSWRKSFLVEGALGTADKGPTSTQEQELRRLHRELAVAQQERDILKKALAYFAKHGN